MLNTSVNFISLIERGQSGLDIVTIVNICNALKIQPNALFNNVVNINTSSNNELLNSLSLLNKEESNIIELLVAYMSNK